MEDKTILSQYVEWLAWLASQLESEVTDELEDNDDPDWDWVRVGMTENDWRIVIGNLNKVAALVNAISEREDRHD